MAVLPRVLSCTSLVLAATITLSIPIAVSAFSSNAAPALSASSGTQPSLLPPPPPPTTTTPTAVQAWVFRQASNKDTEIAAELLELKCAFDRSLSGEPPSNIKPAAGSSLVSLFPELGPSGKMLLVNDGDQRLEEDPPVGFALYQLRYYGLDSPPSLWLEDIYVNGARRSQGAGLALMHELGRVSRQNFCSHLNWKCHVDNAKGNSFYDRMGATVQSQKGDMYNYRWVVPASVV